MNTALAGPVGKSAPVVVASNSWTDAIPANVGSGSLIYTYTVTGDGGTRSATVTQSGTGGGTSPPPTDGVISCAGFTKTHVLNIAWGAPSTAAPRVLTSSAGGFSAGEIVVARFTTPASSAAGIYAQIKSAEWGDQQHQRFAALSTTPCEFPSPNPLGRLSTTTIATTSPAVTYAVGGSSAYYASATQRRTTSISSADAEPGESCNMFTELQKPRAWPRRSRGSPRRQ
jgi:hypothetical protein